MSVCLCILTFVRQPANHILSVQHYITICGLSGSTIFFHIISKWHDYWKKKIMEYKICVLIFSTNFA